MSSRKRISYLFHYTTDQGQTVIKRHRSYLNADGVTEDTPTTQLFLDRVINVDEKVTGTSAGLRHVLSYVRNRKLRAKIPYKPGDEKLKGHIEQILAQPQVDCGDYVGERLIIGGTTNSIQQ